MLLKARLYEILILLLAILVALLIGGIVIFLTGFSPLEAYSSLFYGAFGSKTAIIYTLVKSCPLIFISLGLIVAYRCHFWNIGAEGQLWLGAFAATLLGLFFPEVPTPLFLLLIFIVGFLAGALWGVIPALLKIKFGIGEFVTTLLMNYIGIYFVLSFIGGSLKDPTVSHFQTVLIAPSAHLPRFPGTVLHIGILIAIISVVLIYMLLLRTALGFKIRAAGDNPKAAIYAGISISKYIAIAAIISGGLAGLAGAVEVTGVYHRLIDGFSPGFGYIAIVIALLARIHPIGAIPSSFLFASFFVGADAMQRGAGVPISIVWVIQGLVVLLVLLSEYFIRRLKI